MSVSVLKRDHFRNRAKFSTESVQDNTQTRSEGRPPPFPWLTDLELDGKRLGLGLLVGVVHGGPDPGTITGVEPLQRHLGRDTVVTGQLVHLPQPESESESERGGVWFRSSRHDRMVSRLRN